MMNSRDVYKSQAFCGPKKKPRRARTSTATRARVILAGVLAVTLAALSTASIVLYNKYNPDKFIQSVITALADGDASLTARITSEDLGELDTDSLAPLTAYFSDAAARDRLKAQLEDQVMDPSRTGDAFPALGVQKTPVVFGYCDYKLTVHGVQPVSYTHLDVYKRQNCSFPFTAANKYSFRLSCFSLARLKRMETLFTSIILLIFMPPSNMQDKFILLAPEHHQACLLYTSTFTKQPTCGSCPRTGWRKSCPMRWKLPCGAARRHGAAKCP